MKLKKLLAVLICLAMLIGTMPAVFAAVDENYNMRLFVDEHTAGSTSGVVVKMQVKSTTGNNFAVGTMTNVMFKVDPTVLTLANARNGNPITVPSGDANWGQFVAAQFVTDADSLIYSNPAGNYKQIGDYVYIQMYPSLDGDSMNYEAVSTEGEWVTVSGVYLTFAEGKTVSDLTTASVSLLTVTEAYAAGQNSIASLAPEGTTASELSYGDTDLSTAATPDDLAKPEVVFDFQVSAPAQTLANITFSGTGVSGDDGAYTAALNAPANKDADAATLTINAKAIGDLGDEMTFPADAVWTVVDGEGTVVTLPTGVTFSADGAAATLNIAAVNELGTSTSYTIKVTSGSVSESIAVTITKDAPAVTSVKIFNGDDDVTGETITILKGATEQTVTLTGKIYDQYGAEITSAVTSAWSNGTLSTGFAFDTTTGVITVATDADVTTTANEITFASGTVNAKVYVSVADVTFEWPDAADLIKTGMQYGTANSGLINALTGYKTSTDVEGTFSVKDADTVQDAGDKTITVVFTAGTYTFEKEFNVTIAPKEITVTIAQTAADTYGDAFDSAGFTATSADLVGDDTITVTNWQVKEDGAADYVAAAGEVFNAGTHDVKVELDDAITNYTIKTINGTDKYVVNKAALTATADDAERAYGDENPTFTATVDASGFVNGDTADDVTITWNLTTAATEESDAGDYDITGTATADNYTITVTAGTLTVTKAELSLTAKTDDVELDSADGWDIDDIADGVGLVNGDTLSDVFGTLSVDPDDPAVYTDANGIVTLTFYDAETYEKITDELETGVQYLVDIAVAANDADLTNYETAEKAAAAPTEDTADDYTAITFGGDYPIYPVIYYIATFDAGEGTLSGKTNLVVEEGKTVTETPDVIAPEGATFKGWSINGTDIVDVSSYVITENVTFVAVYETGETPDPEPEPEVEGYIKGYEDGSFLPGQNIRRSEVAKILAVLSKEFNAEATYSGTASDLNLNQWYGVYMAYAIEEGIITGYEDGTVKPTGDIKRGEFAAMLARWLGVEAADGECRFTDMDHWSAPYVEALAELSIFDGYDNGDGTYSFKPENYITRAEVVKAINAALKLVADKTADYSKFPTDMSVSHWAYWEVMAALNTDVKTLAR